MEKEKFIEKNCINHGQIKHVLEKTSNAYKCIKCRSEKVQKRRLNLKQNAINFKGGKCIVCDYKKFTGALDFHHLDETKKDFGISQYGATRSWEKIKLELKKCVLVCSNCHREIHGKIINIDDYIKKDINDETVNGYHINKNQISLKKEIKHQLIITKNESYIENQNEKITKLLNCDIDFSKFGWVNKASLLINQKPQKVNSWMKRYMNDFYENHCFKRK